jgi:cyclic beta-1,2-glucan synthetase
MNPVYHADTPEKVERYRVEPYVVAADVYSAAPYVGRGGWTWYTGSASWMYRLGIEMILGLQRTGDQLQLNPSIPKDWTDYQISYRFGRTLYHILVKQENAGTREKSQIIMDGKALTDGSIALKDDGQTHEVVITILTQGRLAA